MIGPGTTGGPVIGPGSTGGPVIGPGSTARAVHPPTGLMVLTDRRQARRPLADVVRAAVDGGARWVVLREKDLPREERSALADALRAILAPAGGTLIVAGPDPLRGPERPPSGGDAEHPIAGNAVHLAAAGPYPPPEFPLVGRSCHHLAELHRLSTEDYVTLSPVFPSPSKPGYGPPLRPDGLARLIRRTRVPVFALGGISSPDQAAACVAAGAAGVAVLGAIMRAADPAAVVAGLAAVLPTAAAASAPVDPERRPAAGDQPAAPRVTSAGGGVGRGWSR